MTEAQIQQAALAAIRAMDPKARAAFIAMHEAQNEQTAEVARAYAVEGVSRQVRLGSMALESSRVMDGLVDLVADTLAA
ncbi:MAG: hypothetical protein FKY71_18680 [Spiribacter salinus]|uniref:Uncharacterized protein n=1 Tax=Spiribacter salinus TaxID=1335746 RepID=A0A540V831_9GAMM|nr:MAG: hypothetical protein FKY71_18680 [Spiribacter salinus]